MGIIFHRTPIDRYLATMGFTLSARGWRLRAELQLRSPIDLHSRVALLSAVLIREGGGIERMLTLPIWRGPPIEEQLAKAARLAARLDRPFDTFGADVFEGGFRICRARKPFASGEVVLETDIEPDDRQPPENVHRLFRDEVNLEIPDKFFKLAEPGLKPRDISRLVHDASIASGLGAPASIELWRNANTGSLVCRLYYGSRGGRPKEVPGGAEKISAGIKERLAKTRAKPFDGLRAAGLRYAQWGRGEATHLVSDEVRDYPGIRRALEGDKP